jgi:hypothetical protein
MDTRSRTTILSEGVSIADVIAETATMDDIMRAFNFDFLFITLASL